jgi:hypothetical protein
LGKIYKTQDYLRIKLSLLHNLSNASSAKIKYKKPDGTTGEWTAIIEDKKKGVIYYDLPQGSPLTDAGAWTLWAYVAFSDGRVAAGEPVSITIYSEGD